MVDPDPSSLMVMSRTGNGSEVVVHHLTGSGEKSGYVTFPTEEAALSSRPLDWRKPDENLKTADSSILRVAAWQPVAAVPLSNAEHSELHRH